MLSGRLLLTLLLFTAPASAQTASLGVRAGEARVALEASTAAEMGKARGSLHGKVAWRAVRDGLATAELELAAGALNLPVRAILVKINPSRYRFTLKTLARAQGGGAWTVDSAGAGVAFAVNAGQFKEAGAWGWLRVDGEDRGLPGKGSLAFGVSFDTASVVRWIPPTVINTIRRDRTVVTGFQSYPQLLFGGAVPRLALDRKLVDQNHRDARLILGQTDDGWLLIVLTRFDALGGTIERMPIGLTVRESILLASALGARHAIMLDGGVSAQMLVRGPDGTSTAWRGLRSVPVGLVATPR